LKWVLALLDGGARRLERVIPCLEEAPLFREHAREEERRRRHVNEVVCVPKESLRRREVATLFSLNAAIEQASRRLAVRGGDGRCGALRAGVDRWCDSEAQQDEKFAAPASS
jgi:hypothetical protein